MRLRETDPAAKIDSVYTDLGAYCKKDTRITPTKTGRYTPTDNKKTVYEGWVGLSWLRISPWPAAANYYRLFGDSIKFRAFLRRRVTVSFTRILLKGISSRRTTKRRTDGRTVGDHE